MIDSPQLLVATAASESEMRLKSASPKDTARQACKERKTGKQKRALNIASPEGGAHTKMKSRTMKG